jgi:phage terminase large subunit-like protein
LTHLDNLSLRELRQLAYAKMRLPIVEEQERQACRGGLIHFVRYFWHILEPKTKLVEGWPLEAICEHLEAIHFGEITRLLINVPPGFMKSLLTDVLFPAWEHGPMNMPHLRYVTFSYSVGLTMRDNGRFRDLIISPEYQKLWGKRFGLRKVGEERVTNDKTGWKFASSVGGVGTGERGDRVILDDPHNVKESESDVVRQETVRWFKESMSNRLNDIERSAVVVIMQRVHEEDVSGVILSEFPDYCHLMIPMRFDPTRFPVGYNGNDIGWLDPREEDGEYAWAERFPPGALAQFERQPYMWCTPAEAPILMQDLSLRPIGEIKVGDKIVGFTNGDSSVKPLKRRSLTIAEVKSVSVSQQPVVRIMLQSGAVIRCTANHKWYTGRSDADSHQTYKSATIGSVLQRICPDKIEELTDPEDLRLAGWLAGFYDGEGSAVLGNRGLGYPKRCTISFSQGSGRNLPLCHKLEQALTHFGFEFNFREKVRSDRLHKNPNAPPQRWYWINTGNGHRGPCLSTFQRFLHVIKPAKWRDRIAEGALTSRFIEAKEHVISIEPDGVETVYGLETTTGNYVVWGLASSNSGQYQQSPTPRGGGIIKEEMWQLWPSEKYPTCELVLGSLDTASTEKEQNDASALTIWGIFRDGQGSPKAILLYAWEGRLEINDLTILVGLLCSVEKRPSEEYQRALALFNRGDIQVDALYRLPVDRLLVENKNNGISVAHELIRLFGHSGNFAVELIDPKVFGDKVARIIACEPMFADEMIYAPDREFAERVITNVAAVPKTSKWDTPDSVSQALLYMRKTGLLLRKDEQARVTHDELLFKPQPPPLY